MSSTNFFISEKTRQLCFLKEIDFIMKKMIKCSYKDFILGCNPIKQMKFQVFPKICKSRLFSAGMRSYSFTYFDKAAPCEMLLGCGTIIMQVRGRTYESQG